MPVTLALVALLTSAASAGCDPAELDAALAAAEGAFVDGEARSVGAAVQEVRRSLGCVRIAVPPATCARIHRARGFDAWKLVPNAELS